MALTAHRNAATTIKPAEIGALAVCGSPARRKTPTKATSMPNPPCQSIFSPKKRTANNAANGTCACISMTDIAASTPSSPVKPQAKCRNPSVTEIPKTCHNRERSRSINGNSNTPVMTYRMPMNSIGGISVIASLATTKLQPQTSITATARQRCSGFMEAGD